MVATASGAAPPLGALRAQLVALETERDAWGQRRARHVERCARIEQQLKERPSETPAVNGPSTGLSDGVAMPRAKPSKREEMQELREKALQLIKTQQQVASKMTSQLRTMARSPSPPQKPTSATRSRNKLVLVPTTTTALGKRQLGPGTTATPPVVHYPTLARTKDVPSDTTEALASAAFRVATRHYVHTGEAIPRAVLRSSVEAYVGHRLREDETCAIVEASGSGMELLVQGAETTAAEPREPHTPKPVVLSDTNVHAWMAVEKSAVHELMASWSAVSSSDSRGTQLIGTLFAHKWASSILGHHASASASVDVLLAGLLGIDRSEDSSAVVETAFPHMTSLFKNAQPWLDRAVAGKDTYPTASSGSASLTSLRFDRPFDIELESVMKQVHKSRKRPRADPMKVMCMYELSGACNDPNCAFQHQRDYDVMEDECDPTTTTTSRNSGGKPGVELPLSYKALMNQFVQLRDNLQNRWPSITEILSSMHTARTPSIEESTQGNSHLPTPPLDGQSPDEGQAASKDWSEDFVELGSPLSSPGDDEPPANLSLRYCHDESFQDAAVSSRFSASSLEVYLAKNPEDISAWFLLALRWLELEVPWSDENSVRVSESERLLGELQELHRLLNTKGSTPPSHILPREENIEHALHVLSRALEVEANAYCEELWLLHLRLSQLLQDKRDVDGELQMTEQALGFIRTSVPLWRHFLMLQLSCLDKLDDGVATFCALLEAIAAASKQAKRRQIKDAFSVLLCDVVIQLCSLYCDAGRSADASSFLWSLLDSHVKPHHEDKEEGSSAGEGEWQHEVHDQMIGDDILILHVLHVHVSLFKTIPLWLRERSFGVSDAVNVYRLLLSPDAMQMSTGDASEALRICEAAFQTYRDSNWIPPGVEVLRHNWIVVVAASTHIPLSERLERLNAFAHEELGRKTLLPRVVALLGVLFRDGFQKPDEFTKLMEELMARYKTVTSTLPVTQVYQRFGEALHHYLLHRNDIFVSDPFRTEFPTLKFMLTRLSAILPEKNPAYSKRVIKAVMGEVNWTSRRAALADLFSALLRDTLDHIVKCQLGEGDRDDSDEQDITQDTYYLAVQAQLLSQVCGPQVAIDVLDLIVIQGGSSQWSILPRECRRIVWSVRFLLQLDLLRQESDLIPSRELWPLLNRYLADVGPRSDDTSRVAKQELSTRFTIGEEEAIPSLINAVAFCVDYADPMTSSALDLALFRLCLKSTPLHERPNQFVAYQHQLGMSSAFWLSYAAIALHDNDWRRVRSGLRRLVMEDSRVMDAAALRLLVSLELRDKNVQAISLALGHRMRINMLDSAAWGLVGSLEVLFGDENNARIEAISTKLAETGGVRLLTHSVLCDGASLVKVPTSSSRLSHIQFAGSRLEFLPSALAMQLTDALRVLDLSHNALLAIPIAVCRLAKLRVLKLSGNSLVTLPPSIGLLTELQVIELAHNNLSAIPNAFWDRLEALQEVDLRCNALSGISPRVVLLKNLRVLRVAGNHIAWKDLEPLASKLPAACAVDIAPVVTQPGRHDSNEVNSPDAGVGGEDQMTHLSEQRASPWDVGTPVVADVIRVREEDSSKKELTATRSDEAIKLDEEDASEPTERVVDMNNEQESKADSSPISGHQVGGESDGVSVIDVEMTDTSESANPSIPASPLVAPHPPTASPSRDDHPLEVAKDDEDNNGDDEDEVECLGSSMPMAVTTGSSSSDTTPPLTTAIDSDLHLRGEPAPSTEAVLDQLRTVPPGPRVSDELRHCVAAEIEWDTKYLRCTVCTAPNVAGTHQRFNASIMCVDCIAIAVGVLRERGASH